MSCGLRLLPRRPRARPVCTFSRRSSPSSLFPEVRRFAKAVAQEVERRIDDQAVATTTWRVADRVGVFVDFGQNARDRTTLRPTRYARLPTRVSRSTARDGAEVAGCRAGGVHARDDADPDRGCSATRCAGCGATRRRLRSRFEAARASSRRRALRPRPAAPRPDRTVPRPSARWDRAAGAVPSTRARSGAEDRRDLEQLLHRRLGPVEAVRTHVVAGSRRPRRCSATRTASAPSTSPTACAVRSSSVIGSRWAPTRRNVRCSDETPVAAASRRRPSAVSAAPSSATASANAGTHEASSATPPVSSPAVPRSSRAGNGTARAETMSGSARRKRSSMRTSLANSGLAGRVGRRDEPLVGGQRGDRVVPPALGLQPEAPASLGVHVRARVAAHAVAHGGAERVAQVERAGRVDEGRPHERRKRGPIRHGRVIPRCAPDPSRGRSEPHGSGAACRRAGGPGDPHLERAAGAPTGAPGSASAASPTRVPALVRSATCHGGAAAVAQRGAVAPRRGPARRAARPRRARRPRAVRARRARTPAAPPARGRGRRPRAARGAARARSPPQLGGRRDVRRDHRTGDVRGIPCRRGPAGPAGRSPPAPGAGARHAGRHGPAALPLVLGAVAAQRAAGRAHRAGGAAAGPAPWPRGRRRRRRRPPPRPRPGRARCSRPRARRAGSRAPAGASPDWPRCWPRPGRSWRCSATATRGLPAPRGAGRGQGADRRARGPAAVAGGAGRRRRARRHDLESTSTTCGRRGVRASASANPRAGARPARTSG